MDPITRIAALGAAGAGGPKEYFADRLIYGSSVTGTDYAGTYGAYIDSSGNIYDAGWVDTSSPKRAFVMKRDPEGVIQWSRTLSDPNSAYNVRFSHMVSDGTYIYCGGYGSPALVAVYDMNGTLQWQKNYTNIVSVEFLDFDSSGNIFIGGRGGSTMDRSLCIIKLNSSGAVQWAKGYTYPNYPNGGYAPLYNRFQDLAVDTSGNVIASFRVNVGSGSYTAAGLVKLNNSGTRQWDHLFAPGLATNYGGSVDTDSNDNIYWAFVYDYTNYLVKYNPSGTSLINKSTPVLTYPYIDPDDNLWSLLDKFDANLDYLFARDSSNLLLERQAKRAGSDGIYFHSATDTAGNVGWNAYLPDDGSLTGNWNWQPTWGSFYYTTATRTTSAGGTYSDVGTLYEASVTVTDSTATNTDAAETFTNDPYFIG